jgi:hypothetical protein
MDSKQQAAQDDAIRVLFKNAVKMAQENTAKALELVEEVKRLEEDKELQNKNKLLQIFWDDEHRKYFKGFCEAHLEWINDNEVIKFEEIVFEYKEFIKRNDFLGIGCRKLMSQCLYELYGTDNMVGNHGFKGLRFKNLTS